VNTPPSRPSPPSGEPLPAAIFAAAGLLVLATLFAYHNSFSVPFIYDDVPAIAGNPSILRLWPLSAVLTPPPYLTTTGRPVINLSLAINHALSQKEVAGYHAFNLGIHVLAGLTLFGLLRRTLLTKPLRDRFGAAATSLSLAVAALWMLHPLQTESVTYIVQRAESMMGLFYLLTLYCFARGAESGPSRPWFLASVFFCVLGMASKEVMVSVPLIVWLYDRTFISGSFRAAWQKHRGLYLGLAASWLLLAYLVATTGGTRDGSAGFGQGVTPWTYALTQAKAIAVYLKLSFWPRPLVFDYGSAVVNSVAVAAPYVALVCLLLAVTVRGIRRASAFGFAGACFFAILAPSSSIVPVVTETMAEHRMYLPLAAVIATAVLGAYTWLGKPGLVALAGAAVLLAFSTEQRNETYRTHIAIWGDTVAKMPGNGRAHNQLGAALSAAGRDEEALPHYREAVRLQPSEAKAYFNLATALSRQDQLQEAVVNFETALRLKPDHEDAHNNYGLLLMRMGHPEEAVRHYREALRVAPDFAPAHNNLGIALGSAGQLDEAISHFQAALQSRPDYAEASNNLGYALMQTGRSSEAIAHFENALELVPNYSEAHNNLARACDQLGRTKEAAAHYRDVVRLEPGYADGHYHLGDVLLRLGHPAEAAVEFEAALRIAPDHAEARRQLAAVRGGTHAALSPEKSSP
jgi:tetratricopeptide (TPR) repeat protein